MSIIVEYIEKKHHEELRKSRPDWIGTERDVPFGMAQHRWEAFKAKILPGDLIGEYDDLGPLCGSAGYCIIRNGKVVERFGTTMS